MLRLLKLGVAAPSHQRKTPQSIQESLQAAKQSPQNNPVSHSLKSSKSLKKKSKGEALESRSSSPSKSEIDLDQDFETPSQLSQKVRQYVNQGADLDDIIKLIKLNRHLADGHVFLALLMGLLYNDKSILKAYREVKTIFKNAPKPIMLIS